MLSPSTLSTLQLVDGQEDEEEDIWRRRCDLDGPTIAHHLFGLFSPEAIEEGRMKGEMYGTRMLVVCGRLSSLCWRFVVLNRDTRERGLCTWAALDSRRNSSHSGAS